MSRSRRKSPVLATTSRGNPQNRWKRKINRRLRRRVAQAILYGDEPLPEMLEISDLWDSPKDGQVSFWGETPESWPSLPAMLRK